MPATALSARALVLAAAFLLLFPAAVDAGRVPADAAHLDALAQPLRRRAYYGGEDAPRYGGRMRDGGPADASYYPDDQGYPPDEGYYPEDQGYYPEDQGYYPEDQGYYPEDQGYYPEDQGYYPEDQGYYPEDQGYYPENQGYYPEDQGYYPEDQGYPPDEGYYPEDRGYYPEDRAQAYGAYDEPYAPYGDEAAYNDGYYPDETSYPDDQGYPPDEGYYPEDQGYYPEDNFAPYESAPLDDSALPRDFGRDNAPGESYEDESFDEDDDEAYGGEGPYPGGYTKFASSGEEDMPDQASMGGDTEFGPGADDSAPADGFDSGLDSDDGARRPEAEGVGADDDAAAAAGPAAEEGGMDEPLLGGKV